MTNDPAEIKKQKLGLMSLRLFPPMVRSSLAELKEFVEAFNFETSAAISFGSDNLAFDQTEFIAAVRELYSQPQRQCSIRDSAGNSYNLNLKEQSGDWFLTAERDGQIIPLPSFWFISPDAGFRAMKFDELIKSKNLYGTNMELWRDTLMVSPLSDLQMDDFVSLIKLNVSDVSEQIVESLSNGSIAIASLVPQTATYYQHLVGEVSGIDTLQKYVTTVAPTHIQKMLAWDGSSGLAQALLLASHATICSLIDLGGYEVSYMMKLGKWIFESGDRFSQVAFVEAGLHHLDRFPEMEIYIRNIIDQICDDNPESNCSRVAFTSNLVVFVDGELARLGMLRDWPPFLRRLASIAHASLIERAVLRLGIDLERFGSWALEARGGAFYMQTFADLRLEPRWLPDFIDGHQLKAEFISRIANAGVAHRENGMSPDLHRFLCGEDSSARGVRANLKYPMSFFPGPLEGASVSPADLPQDLVADLQKPAQAAFLESKFFAGIVNSALVFRITPEHAALVREALQSVNHRLKISSEPHVTFSFLSGLAIIAAVTRSPDLAKDVSLLADSLRQRDSANLPPENLMRIGLIAAAANLDLESWCKSVGDSFLNIAHGNLDKARAISLQNQLHQLCQIVPQLWKASGKANSALAAASGW